MKRLAGVFVAAAMMFTGTAALASGAGSAATTKRFQKETGGVTLAALTYGRDRYGWDGHPTASGGATPAAVTYGWDGYGWDGYDCGRWGCGGCW